MENKDPDIRVAEILGYEVGKMDSGESEFYTNLSDVCIAPGGRGWQAIPAFTTDPAADYKVLEWCSTRMKFSQRANFERVLQEIISWRHEVLKAEGTLIDFRGLMWMYEPGDYSRALLELDKNGLLK